SSGWTNQRTRTTPAMITTAHRSHFCRLPSGVYASRNDAPATVTSSTIEGTIMDRQCGRISNSICSPSVSSLAGYPMRAWWLGSGRRRVTRAQVHEVAGPDRRDTGRGPDQEPARAVDVQRQPLDDVSA